MRGEGREREESELWLDLMMVVYFRQNTYILFGWREEEGNEME